MGWTLHHRSGHSLRYFSFYANFDCILAGEGAITVEELLLAVMLAVYMQQPYVSFSKVGSLLRSPKIVGTLLKKRTLTKAVI